MVAAIFFKHHHSHLLRGNSGPERLSNVPSITQLVSNNWNLSPGLTALDLCVTLNPHTESCIRTPLQFWTSWEQRQGKGCYMPDYHIDCWSKLGRIGEHGVHLQLRYFSWHRTLEGQFHLVTGHALAEWASLRRAFEGQSRGQSVPNREMLS